MQVDIIETPIRFQLYGKRSAVHDNRYGEVRMRLINEMIRRSSKQQF